MTIDLGFLRYFKFYWQHTKKKSSAESIIMSEKWVEAWQGAMVSYKDLLEWSRVGLDRVRAGKSKPGTLNKKLWEILNKKRAVVAPVRKFAYNVELIINKL